MKLICKTCNLEISKEVSELKDLSLINSNDREAYIPEGFFLINNDETTFSGQKGAIIINIKDLVNSKRHSNISRLNGCCGLDGCDGMNRVCLHNHEIGTEKSDCWMPHFVTLNPDFVQFIEFSDPSHYDAENNTYIGPFDQKLIHEKPPVEPTEPKIPTLDEKKKEEYKKCIYVALQLLIQENKATGDLLTLFNEERFFEITKLFRPKFEIEYPHMITLHCVVTLLEQIMEHNIVDSDQLIRILQYEDNPALEVFLASKLT